MGLDFDTARAMVRNAKSVAPELSFSGIVQHGAKLGRTLGFPTINLVSPQASAVDYGIYASRTRLPDGRILIGATNYGIRPTFSPPIELIETFLFDFDADLYGTSVEVELVRFFRPEKAFADVPALVRQMTLDCEMIRAFFDGEYAAPGSLPTLPAFADIAA